MIYRAGQPQYAPIEDCPGYRVGDDGTVWSRLTRGSKPRLNRTWHQLKLQTDPCGYKKVTLGYRNQRKVHRLVLEAFVGPCPPGMECLHGDGDPSNNHLWNLRWGTRLENGKDMVRHGRCCGASLTDQQVAVARILVKPGQRTVIPGRLAKRWGVSISLIYKVTRAIKR